MAAEDEVTGGRVRASGGAQGGCGGGSDRIGGADKRAAAGWEPAGSQSSVLASPALSSGRDMGTAEERGQRKKARGDGAEGQGQQLAQEQPMSPEGSGAAGEQEGQEATKQARRRRTTKQQARAGQQEWRVD